MAELQAVHAIFKEKPLVMVSTESMLLSFPGVPLVKLGPDATIDSAVLRWTMQLLQVVRMFELLLCSSLNPLATLFLHY